MPLSEEARAEIAQVLKVQHGQVVRKIEDILNGQDVDLNDIGIQGFVDPNLLPLEQLRQFMRHLDATRKLLREGGYGRCARCGAEIEEPALRELPWADRCRPCAAKGT